MIRLAGLTLLLGLAFAAPAAAAPGLERLGTFIGPTWAGAAPGDKGRVFVAERSGRISTITGTSVATYMDIGGTVLSTASERGLLSVAFAPDFATSKKLYVYVTAQPAGALEVREYTNGDPASVKVLVSVPHDEETNHNGGQLQFAPNGWLYAGTGDGGGANDEHGHAQDPDSGLGKLLRIDPGTEAVEQVAVGLRNPWRFSFDGSQIVIADVGQNAREEINVGFATNYGWPCKEGTINGPRPTDPRCATGTHAPVLEKTHSGDGFCSITGGYVVRDPGLPTLDGRYVYGDFCNPALRSVDLANPSTDAPVGIDVRSLSSFGVDACGRVLVVSLNGDVSRIVDGTATPCEPPVDPTPTPTETATVGPTVTATVTTTATATASPSSTASPSPTATSSATPTPSPTPTPTPSPQPTALPARVTPTASPLPPPPVADARPCVRGVRVTGGRSLAKRGYLSVALRTNRRCSVTISAPRFRTVTKQLEAGARTVVKLRRTRGTAKRFTVTVRSGTEVYRTSIRAR